MSYPHRHTREIRGNEPALSLDRATSCASEERSSRGRASGRHYGRILEPALGGLARAAGLYSTTPRYDGCFELVAGAGFEPATFSFMSLAFVLGAMTFGNNLAEKIGLPADKKIRIWPIRCAFTGPNRYPDPDVTSCTPLAVLRSMVRSH